MKLVQAHEEGKSPKVHELNSMAQEKISPRKLTTSDVKSKISP
jgi:hypothetical protein